MNQKRVRFLKDFDWKPSAMVTVAYRAGETKLVDAACAEAAIARDAAEAVAFPVPDISAVKKARRKSDV